MSHLRIRRPIGEFLEPLPYLVVLQDVKSAELDFLFPQQRDRLAAEATPRSLGVSLHEEHYSVRRNERLESVFPASLATRETQKAALKV